MPADRDLSASAHGRARRSGFADFVHWWAGELGPLVPRAARSAVRRRRLRPVLAVDGDAATLWQPAVRGGELVLETVASISLAEGSDAVLAEGLAAVGRLRGTAGAARVTLALPGRQTLRRTLKLPAALEENLKQALAYDLDRHTPFKADDLYFDAAVIGRDQARGEIRVDLAAARRSVVEQALEQARAWGADVVAVSPDAPSSVGASKLDLLPEDQRPSRRGRGLRLVVPLVLLAAAVATAIALPLWQKREHAIALHREVDAARSQAAVSDGLRTELMRLAGDYNFALERKFMFPPAVQVLDEITKLLPDDTWLTQMELKTTARVKEQPQRELLLRGESGNAGRLITLFEESKVFAQAAPRSPTTKIQPGPGEIFDLVAQLRTLPPPAPVDLAAPTPDPASAAGAAALPAAPAAPAADAKQAPKP